MMDKSIMPAEKVINNILVLRNKKVILDRDIAKLYNVETRVLNKRLTEI